MTDGEDRERLSSARRAAEALFGPKHETHNPPASDPGQPIEARKPRVLPALTQAPIRYETVDIPAASAPTAAPEIPARKSAHIRTLVKYGMTAGQVAELYGVPVETVERLLRKS
jgi:hypothetical protein